MFIIKANSQIYEYYVSNTGNDNNSGSQVAPFATIEKAKNTIRIQLRDYPMTQDIVVHITGGTYKLDYTLQFTNEDSGNNGHFVIYQGETSINKTIISSGKIITGWTKIGNSNIYQANIGNLYSRQVYINGVKGVRSRSDDSMELIETNQGYFSTKHDFSNWNRVKDIEIVSQMFWRSYRIPIETICENQIIMDSFFWHNLVHNEGVFLKTAPVKWVENSFDLLDKQNEWYIDRLTNPGNNKLYIVSNTEINTVIMPVLETLISGQNVENIKFKNLIFAYSKWDEPSRIKANNNINGFFTEQADAYNVGLGAQLVKAAISFKEASNISFINNEIIHIGSTGINFGENSKKNLICSNKFEDIAASAIRVGIIKYNATQVEIDSIYNNKIINNTINDIGNEYFGSVAIFVPYAKNTTISNNTLTNFPYTGISVGWGWNINDSDKTETHVGTNIISKNRINCTKQILPDAGGIYTLNAQRSNSNDIERTQITGNYIVNQRFYLSGIYMDNRSSYIDVKDNLIDSDEQLIIPSCQEVDCLPNKVFSIGLHFGSKDVNIENNYYNNDKYSKPSEESDCKTNVNFPCTNIIVSGNISTMSANETELNRIISESGVKSNICF